MLDDFIELKLVTKRIYARKYTKVCT